MARLVIVGRAGVIALVLALQGVAALPVVAAQLVVNCAVFLFSSQALPTAKEVAMLMTGGATKNIQQVFTARKSGQNFAGRRADCCCIVRRNRGSESGHCRVLRVRSPMST